MTEQTKEEKIKHEQGQKLLEAMSKPDPEKQIGRLKAGVFIAERKLQMETDLLINQLWQEILMRDEEKKILEEKILKLEGKKPMVQETPEKLSNDSNL